MLSHLLRRQHRHTSRRLRLPVHQEHLLAGHIEETVELANRLRRHPATGLTHIAQVRQLHFQHANPLEHLERIGNGRNRRDPVTPHQTPEPGLHRAQAGQHRRGTGLQMAVQHRQSERIEQRQTSQPTLVLGNPQRIDNGPGVVIQIVLRQLHHLRIPGSRRRRQQQRHVRAVSITQINRRHGVRRPKHIKAVVHCAVAERRHRRTQHQRRLVPISQTVDGLRRRPRVQQHHGSTHRPNSQIVNDGINGRKETQEDQLTRTSFAVGVVTRLQPKPPNAGVHQLKKLVVRNRNVVVAVDESRSLAVA